MAASCWATAVPTETGNLNTLLAHEATLPPARRLAAEQFTRPPRLRQVHLSPDGVWIGYLEANGDSHRLKLLNIKSGAVRQLLPSIGASWLSWSTDSSTIFVADPGSVSAVAIKDGGSARIAALDGRLTQQMRKVDPSHPHHVLIDEFDAATERYRITRVDKDGARETLYEGRRLFDFLVDHDGKLGVGKWLDDNHTAVLARRQGDTWRQITRCQPMDDCALVTASASHLTTIMAADADRSALVELGWKGQARRLLHADPDGLAEVRRIVSAPGSGRPLFAVYESPTLHNVGLTSAAQRAAIDIDKKFSGSEISIEAGDDGATLLLVEGGARLPQERYWLYDGSGRRLREILRDEREAGDPLTESDLARTIPLHYRATDGLLVHGYLTLPPGRPAAQLPLMTIVHGGPWARANAGYSPLVQLLANRGVAVFQPNFRASVGYGQRYMTMAGTDFGDGRVQADIIDGVRWLLAHGVGDQRRLAIMGNSFGGYSTLLALTHTPRLFQFGVATVPPPDFARSLRAIASDARDEMPGARRLRDFGVELDNAAAMKTLTDAAPANNAGKIVKPLLIMAAGRDEMVPIASVTDYVARLQEANKPVSLMIAPDEGHNPRQPLFHQAQMYLLERMLQRYLGGAPPAPPSAELNNYLRQTIKVNNAFPLR